MHLGGDFFKIIQLITAILRLWGRIFGDDEDRANDDEAENNHKHEIDVIIHPGKTKPTKGGD